MNRAQLKHALLKKDLPNHPKVKALKRVHGVAGKCSIYEIYMLMSGATNAVVDKDSILQTAEENGVTDIEGYFQYCLDKGLIQRELDGFSNQPVIDDQEAYYRKLIELEADAERKRQVRERERQERLKADNPSDNPATVPGLSPDIPPDNPRTGSGKPVYVDDNVIDPNIKLDSRLTLPNGYNTPEMREALGRCAAKLEESGRKLNQITLEAKICSLGTPARLLAALRHTAGLTKTLNIYEPQENGAPKKQTQAEKIMEMGSNLARRKA